jgi:pyruvate formate-lyase/glycerol dehydratase family glycyl radical enzyme
MNDTGCSVTVPDTVEAGGSPRIHRLRERVLSAVPEICTQRAVLITESFRETEDEPIEIRRAKALEKILGGMDLFILTDELIVGHQSEKHRSPAVYPECNVEWIFDEAEMASFETRLQNRLMVPPRAKGELLESAAYWRGKTLFKKAWALFPESVRQLRRAGGFSISHEKYAFGHCIPDWGKLLRVGFKGLRDEVAAQLRSLDLADPANLGKREFLQSLLIVIDASSLFIRRYAALAAEKAGEASDPVRRGEFEKISEVCRWIAENPARSLHEALQLQWFAHLISIIETNGYSISFGRVDQYFYPYYRADIEQGRLTPEQAQELVECFWIKPNEIIHVDDTESATYHGGHPLGLNLIVGGMTREGRDAANDLTYMFLQAHADVRLYLPNFGVRIFRGSPEKLLQRTSEVIALGTGMPQVFNDETLVPALMRYGLPIEEARNYSPTGCVENSTDKAWGRGNGGWINMAKAIEFALNGGRCSFTGLAAGLPMEEAATPRNYEEFEQAFRRQLSYIIQQMVIEDNILDNLHAAWVPELMVSLLHYDCIRNGKSATAGGARYNFTSPMSIGVATVGDSLAAIKKLVYEEKRVTLPELRQALAENFAGREPLRQMLINRAPKFGNDDPYVDDIVAEVQKFFTSELGKYRSPRGGVFRPGFWTILANMTLGRLTGATPDGRLAKEALSDSIGPSNGCDRKDATAMLCSAGRIDQTAAANGTVLNLRLSPAVLKGEGGQKRLGQVIRSYFHLGGTHLAINLVSSDTLRDAQKNPERHRDLIVKVAGYAAFFVELGEKTQNDIIARTEHS